MESEKERNLLVLAVVGMPATGKSAVIEKLKTKFNFFHLYYGDITFDEITRLGLGEINEKNERVAREGLRASGDLGIYSKKIIPKIDQAITSGQKLILLESMYNIYEYEVIKEKYGDSFKVLAIHSDQDIRLKRLQERKDRRLTEEELISRQVAEAKNLQKGTVISFADYHLVNNGSKMEVFERDLLFFLKETLGLSQSELKIKNYDGWNSQKKYLDIIQDQIKFEYPKKREVWMIDLGINLGYEQNGDNKFYNRPVLVFKKFNNQMFWGIPLSSNQKKQFDFYFNFTDPHDQKVSAILAQMKLFSVKRFQRKMYDLDSETFNEIRNAVSQLI